jgi:predicted acyltransferase
VDELGWKRITQPFVILGRNAIAIYMVSELLAETLSSLHWQKPLYQALFASWASPINASLLWAISYTLLMFLVAWFMNRRGWFLRV